MEQKTQFFLSIINRFGWLGNWLFFLVALIECLPFIGGFFPGGTLVSIGGFFAAQGHFNIWEIIIFATIGAVIGDFSGYSLGRWGSDWLLRQGLIKPALMSKGQDFFTKHGAKSIFWGRFIGATRAVVPFIAGASRMKSGTFLFWNVVSAIGWAAFNAGLGYFSGNIIAIIWQKWSHRLGLVAIVTAIVLVSAWVAHRHGETIIQYFKNHSLRFKDKLTSTSRFNKLAAKEPIVEDFFSSPFAAERIYATSLIISILAASYILAEILDLF